MDMSRLSWLVVGGIAFGAVYAVAPVHVVWDDHATAAVMRVSYARSGTTLPQGRLADLTAVVARVGPSAANVTTRTRTPDPFAIAERHFEIYRRLAEQARAPSALEDGAGSGSMRGDDGCVRTNAHDVASVVMDAAYAAAAQRKYHSVRQDGVGRADDLR